MGPHGSHGPTHGIPWVPPAGIPWPPLPCPPGILSAIGPWASPGFVMKFGILDTQSFLKKNYAKLKLAQVAIGRLCRIMFRKLSKIKTMAKKCKKIKNTPKANIARSSRRTSVETCFFARQNDLLGAWGLHFWGLGSSF